MTKKRKNSLVLLSCSVVTAVSVVTGVFINNFSVRAKAATPIQTSEYFFSMENMVVETAKANTKGEKGITVTLNNIAAKEKAAFEYKNYISVEELQNGFLEMSLQPSSYAKVDNDSVIVTLTDAMDETQKLVWAVTAQPDTCSWWSEWTGAQVAFVDDLTPLVQPAYASAYLMKIKGTSQSIHGKNSFLAATHPLWYSDYMDCGQLIESKYSLFVRKNSASELNSMKFSFKGTNAILNNKTVADIADSEFLYQSSQFLYGTEYEGRYTQEYVENLFSSGYCKLKIEYQGIKNDSITCHIKSIGQQVFVDNEGCKVEAASPLVYADVCDNALLGYDYVIPTVYSHDITDGELTDKVTVEILDENRTAVHTGFSNYVFNKAGDYSLAYSVANLRGDEFTKYYPIRCYAEVPETTFGFITEYKKSYAVGDSIIIPSTIAKNAIKVDEVIEANVLIQKDGQVIDRYTNEKNIEYMLSDAGNYAVVFRYTNIYGITHSEVRRFTVEKGFQLRVQNPVSFTVGVENAIYDFEATDYYSDIPRTDMYRAIFVNGTNVYTAREDKVISGSLKLASNLFTEKGIATLEYKVGFEADNYIFTQSYSIPVLQLVYMGDGIITYTESGVSTEGMTVINQTANVAYETAVDGGFKLPQAISRENMALVFNAREGKSNFDSMTVIFESFADSNKKVSFTVSAISETESSLKAQGSSKIIAGSLINPKAKFSWVWDNKKSVLCNDKGEAITETITLWDNDTAFDGFAEGIVVRFEFNGVREGGAGIELESVANHSFISSMTDAGAQPMLDAYTPYIEVKGDYSTVKAKYRSTLTIYSAKAYDVWDANVTLYVTVKAPDGTVVLKNVSCEQDYKISINQFGKWDITYTAYDTTNLLKQNKRFSMNVNDEEAPILSIAQPPKELYAVGQTISFEGVSAFDNFTQDCKISIFIVAPDSGRELVDGQYTFEETGVYRIIYQAVDEMNNYTLKSYEVKVSGGVQ